LPGARTGAQTASDSSRDSSEPQISAKTTEGATMTTSGIHEKKFFPPRVTLTQPMLQRLNEIMTKTTVAAMAERTGLPYLLIYNIVHKRVRSLSTRNYRIIFGESPPPQKQIRTDGAPFRELVALWLFLNDDATKADLYREFYGRNHTRRVDYRIFTGKTRSVDPGFATHLENKFSACGIDPDTVRRWSLELALGNRDAYVPYDRVQPLLSYLSHHLGIHPTTLLHQWARRYESGNLKRVSHKVYARIRDLKERAEAALASGSRLEIEKVREAVYTPRPGYTLFAAVAQELEFLRKYAGRGAKQYLGRSISMYRRGECKRLPTWRAKKIRQDCRAFIQREPHLPLSVLPRSVVAPLLDALTQVLTARTADLLSRTEGIRMEKQILKPSRASDEYKKQIYGFTRFDRAGKALGMRKAAFDLMVAENCEIFRKIGTYTHRWYLSDLYLKELVQKRDFALITAKYEWLARKGGSAGRSNDRCLN
jgi:hypothetical protein